MDVSSAATTTRRRRCRSGSILTWTMRDPSELLCFAAARSQRRSPIIYYYCNMVTLVTKIDEGDQSAVPPPWGVTGLTIEPVMSGDPVLSEGAWENIRHGA